MSIQRYRFYYDCIEPNDSEMLLDNEGDYVEYDDHISIVSKAEERHISVVDKLQARIAELEKECYEMYLDKELHQYYHCTT